MKTLSKEEARAYSPNTLAFFGDSVYELFVRHKIIIKGCAAAGYQHDEAVKRVRAPFQACAALWIEDKLSEEESDILRRGRNANGVSVPKSCKPSEYRRATGLEALFGYLWLIGDFNRLEEIFEMIYDNVSV